MSNLVQTSVRFFNELHDTYYNREELLRIFYKTKGNVKFDYSSKSSTDFGCPLGRKSAMKK